MQSGRSQLPSPGARAKILIVDDDAGVRKLIRTTLRKEGFETIEAENGHIGAQRAIAEQPALMILDIQMAELDGVETLRAIRANPDTRDLPVIMVTALDDAATVVSCLRDGANDFVTKPFHREELLARVTAHIQARESAKLRALLEFAGAACHEMNQPLQVILGHCELMLQLFDGSAELRHVRAIAEASRRLALIVERIKRVDRYETKSYLGGSRILDLHGSAESVEAEQQAKIV